MQDGEKPSKMKENDGKPSENPSKMKENGGKPSNFPSLIVKNVYEAIKMNRKAKYSWLQDNLGVSESTIVRAINDLKRLGYIDAVHSKVNGEWQLLK